MVSLVSSVPLEAEEVLELRVRVGFASPIPPVERGSRICLFAQRGTWEWLVHPDDARGYLADGVVMDGRRLSVAKVDEYPLMGAWHLVASDPGANQEWIEAAAA